MASISLGTVMLTGCGVSPSSTYTGGDGSFIRLPGNWSIFDGNQVLQASDPEATVSEGVYLSGFALGSTDPSDIITSSSQPTGLLLSTDIPEGTPTDADRQIVITNLADMFASGTATFVEKYRPFTTADGVAGERSVVDITAVDGKQMRLLQQTITNPERTRIWVLAVACSTTCYKEDNGTIENIAQNWKVDVK